MARSFQNISAATIQDVEWFSDVIYGTPSHNLWQSLGVSCTRLFESWPLTFLPFLWCTPSNEWFQKSLHSVGLSVCMYYIICYCNSKVLWRTDAEYNIQNYKIVSLWPGLKPRSWLLWDEPKLSLSKCTSTSHTLYVVCPTWTMYKNEFALRHS